MRPNKRALRTDSDNMITKVILYYFKILARQLINLRGEIWSSFLLIVDELRRRMEAKDTSLAPKMAPPTGLYFLHVKYPETTERNPDDGIKIPYHL